MWGRVYSRAKVRRVESGLPESLSTEKKLKIKKINKNSIYR